MASSKVMASRSPASRDRPRQPSPSPARLNLQSDQSRGFGSMNIDDILRNIYSDSESIGGGGGNGESAMTLEDFLAKAGAVNEEDVRVSATPLPPTDVFGVEMGERSIATGFPAVVQGGMATGGFGASGVVAVSGGGGRGKRKAGVEDLPLDKATQQRQRRMIKNRESAARSRERKQVSLLSSPVCCIVCIFYSLDQV